MLAAAAVPLSAAPLKKVPFNSMDWEIDSVIYWRWKGDRVCNISVGGMVSSRLVPENPFRAKITLTPEKRTSISSAECGFMLAVAGRPQNGWTLSLFDDGKKRTAFLQFRAGEKVLITADKILTGKDFFWNYKTSYDLEIKADSGRAEGIITDVSGKVLFHAIADGGKCADTPLYPRLFASTMPCSYGNAFASSDKIRQDDPIPAQRFTGGMKYVSPANVSREYSSKATGFFRIEQDKSGRYWYIDPNGKALFLNGVDMLTYWGRHCEALGYAPYCKNMDKKFNCDELSWRDSTLERLQKWGFNFSATTQDFFYTKLPFSNIIMVGSSFAALGDEYDICPYMGAVGSALPNPFHPDFAKHAKRRYIKLLGADITNPYLVGFFSDNEMRWLGSSRNRDGSGVFDDVMKKKSTHTAKKALVDLLRKHYNNDIAAFNSSWNTRISSFDAILDLKELKHTGPEHIKVKQKYLSLVAETYFSTISRTIKEIDPNHLYLGCRYAGFYSTHEVIWRATGKYCDVVTLNMYPCTDPETNRIWVGEYDISYVFETLYKWTKRPLMITEWAYLAFDSGLPCSIGAGQRVNTQEERTACAELFLRWMATRPYMVGVNWFKHSDDPREGVRLKMGENSNYGLVDVMDRPYGELVAMFSRVQNDIDAMRNTPVKELRLPRGGKLYQKYAQNNGVKRSTVNITDTGISNGKISVVLNKVKNRLDFFSGRQKMGELALMCRFVTLKGRHGYPQASRVENVKVKQLDNAAEMTLTAFFKTDRKAEFAMDVKILLPEDKKFVISEILQIQNRGSENVYVNGVYFCPYPAFDAPQREEYPDCGGVQTNLFRKRCAWYRADNSYFAAVSSLTRIHFVCKGDSRKNHLSNGFIPLLPRDFVPGEIWKPEDRCYIFLFAGKGDYNNIAGKIARQDLDVK